MSEETEQHVVFSAARKGDVAGVLQYLKAGGEANVRNADNDTPLWIALDLGHRDVVKALVKEGCADPDARRPSKQWTPLFYAAYSGQADMVSTLIAVKADPAAVHENGTTPGELFAEGVTVEEKEAVRSVLRERLEKTGCKHIYAHEGAREGNLERIAWYLAAGGNINARDSSQYTMLHIGCKEGRYNVVSYLLENGAEVDSKDGKKWTPLYLAAMNGQFDMVKLLLSMGASANSRTHDSRTPLHGACRFGHQDIVYLLLNQGAMVDSKDGNGDTPLHWACERGGRDLAKELISRGADVNSRDKSECSPLHWCCMSSEPNRDLAKELISHGADKNAMDAEQRTPLHLAADKGYMQLVTELLIRGANINDADVRGYSALHYACAKGHEDVVFELLDRGCDISLLDKEDHVPSEVIGAGLPPGHVPQETIQAIKKLIRDGPRGRNNGPKTVETELRCLCTIS